MKRSIANSKAILLTALSLGLVVGCGEETQFTGAAVTTQEAELEEGVNTDDAKAVLGKGEGDQVIAGGPGSDGDKDKIDSEVEVGSSKKDSSEDTNTQIEMSFTVDNIKLFEKSVDLEDEKVRQDIKMAHEETIVSGSKNFAQVIRTPIADTFTQGNPGTDKVETFAEDERGIVDILLVVDNSGSMREEQAGLADKLSALLSEVSDSSWQISVVTTDLRDNCNRALIKAGDQNASEAFRAAVTGAGTNGDGNERGIAAAVQGLQCANNWVRPNSSLAVLVVSDEDNCSNGSGCSGDYAKQEYLFDTFASMGRTTGVNARAYGIFWKPGTTCGTAYYRAHVYEGMVSASGGVSGSICDSDYTATLNKISTDVKAILKTEWELSAIPDSGSVKVFVKEKDASGYTLRTSGVTVTGKTVALAAPYPGEGASVKVEYTVGANPKYKDFDLSEKPAAGTVSVLINGQAPSASQSYTIDYANKKIKFDAEPADMASIKVNYRKDDALLNKWNIPKNSIQSSIAAKVDGTSVGLASFDMQTGDVVLKNVPADGAEVVVDYQTKSVGAKILAYKFDAGSAAKNLMVMDKSTAATVQFSYEDGKIKFPEEEFVDGRMVQVAYDMLVTDLDNIALDHVPLEGSLKVNALDEDGQALECATSLYKYEDKSVKVLCVPEDTSKINVSYMAEDRSPQSFKLEGAEDLSGMNVSVYVNGKATKGFEIKDGEISMKDALPHGAKVKVIAESNNT